MGIQELEIKGFKSLRNVRWTPGRLNVLIGPNGSGKSNLLQALELLQASTSQGLPQQIVSLGGMGQILWDGREKGLSWAMKLDSGLGHDFDYKLELARLGNSSSYLIQHESLRLEDHIALQRTSEKTFFEGQPESFAASFAENRTAISYATFPMLGPLAHDFREAVQSWAIHYDLRTNKDSPLRTDTLTRFEERLATDGQNLIPVLHTLYSGDREFKRIVDDAMRAAFGPEYEDLAFPPSADQRIQLRMRWQSLESELSSGVLSDGILRFLLLVTILCNPNRGNLIAIDEPETGLHPGMFPIIAELAAEAAEQTQVIFTTHSPQFLDAFKEEIPTTTVLEWLHGETRLTVLDGGDLQRWLAHYSLGDMFLAGDLEAMT